MFQHIDVAYLDLACSETTSNVIQASMAQMWPRSTYQTASFEEFTGYDYRHGILMVLWGETRGMCSHCDIKRAQLKDMNNILYIIDEKKKGKDGSGITNKASLVIL